MRPDPTNAPAEATIAGLCALQAVKGYLDALADTAAAPVIERYKGVLAAADVFTASTAFWVMESIRLDLGYGSYVHP